MDLQQTWPTFNQRILPDLMQTISTAGNMFKSNKNINRKVNSKGSRPEGIGKDPNANVKTKRSRNTSSSDPKADKVKGQGQENAVLCTSYVKLDTSFVSFESPDAKVRKVSDFGSPVSSNRKNLFRSPKKAKIKKVSNFGSPGFKNKENTENLDGGAIEGLTFVEALSPTFEVEIPPTSLQNSFIEHSFSGSHRNCAMSDNCGVVGLRYQKVDENESMRENPADVSLYEKKQRRSGSLKSLQAYRESEFNSKKRSNSLRISRDNVMNTSISWEKSLADRGRKTLNFLKNSSDDFRVKKESSPKPRRKLLATKRSLAKTSLRSATSLNEDDISEKSFSLGENKMKYVKSIPKSSTPQKEEKRFEKKELLGAKTLDFGHEHEQPKVLKKKKSASRFLRSERSGVFKLGDTSTLRLINRQNASSRLQAIPGNGDNVVGVGYRKTGTPRIKQPAQRHGCSRLKRQGRVEENAKLKPPRKDSTGSSSNGSSDKENSCTPKCKKQFMSPSRQSGDNSATKLEKKVTTCPSDDKKHKSDGKQPISGPQSDRCSKRQQVYNSPSKTLSDRKVPRSESSVPQSDKKVSQSSDSKVTQCESKVSQSKSKVSQSESKKVSQSESKVSQSEGKLTQSESKVSQSESKVSQSESKVTQSESKVSQSESKVSQSESKVTQYESKVSQSESKVTQYESKVSQSESKVTQSESKVSQSESKVSQSESKVSQSESKVSQSESKVTQYESKVSQSESKVTQSESKVTQSESKVTPSESKVTQSESKVTQSESKETPSESKMTQSESKVSQSESHGTQSGSKVSQSGSKVTQSESKMTQSESKVSQSESHGTQSGSKVSQSGSKVTQSESKVTQSESKVTQSESKVTPSESKVTQSESKMTQSESKVSQSESKGTQSGSKVSQSESKVTQSESKMTQSESKGTQSGSKVTQSESKVSQSESKGTQSGSKMTQSESKVSQSESKMTQSESKVSQSSDCKVTRYESKVTQSDSKVTSFDSKATQSDIPKGQNSSSQSVGQTFIIQSSTEKSCDNCQTSAAIFINGQVSLSPIIKSTQATRNSLGQQRSQSVACFTSKHQLDQSNEILPKPKCKIQAVERVIQKPLLNKRTCEGEQENQVSVSIQEIIDNSSSQSSIEPPVCRFSDDSVIAETLGSPVKVSGEVDNKDIGISPPPFEERNLELNVSEGNFEKTNDQELGLVNNSKWHEHQQEFQLQRQLSWVVGPVEETSKAYDSDRKGVYRRSCSRANSCPSLKGSKPECTLCVCKAHYRDADSLRLDHSVIRPDIGKCTGLTDRGTSLASLGQNGGSLKEVSEEGLRDSTRNTNSSLTQEDSKLCEGDETRTISLEDNQNIREGDSHSESCAIYNQIGKTTDYISRSIEANSSKLSCDQIWNISGCGLKQIESEGLDFADELGSSSCWLNYFPEDEEGPEWKELCNNSWGILGKSKNNEIGTVHIDASHGILGQGDKFEGHSKVKSEVGVMASLKRFLSPKKSSKEPKEPKEKTLQKSSKSLLRGNTGPKLAGSSSNPGLLGISKRENGSDVPSQGSPGGVAVSYGKSPDIKSPGVEVASSGSSLVNGKARQPSTGRTPTVSSKTPTKSTGDKKLGLFSSFSRADATRRSAREQSATEKLTETQGFKRNDLTRRSLPVRSLSMSAVTKPPSTIKLRSKEVLNASDKENKAITETKKQISVPDLNKNEDDDQIWVKRESRLYDDNDKNESQDINKTKREIHVSSKTAQNLHERKTSEPLSAGSRKLSEPTAGPNKTSDTVDEKHPVAASAENLAGPPRGQQRIGRVQSHYHVRGNNSHGEIDSSMWRTTSQQEVSTSPYKLDKRSSFDSNASVFSEPDKERPHSMDLDSELSDASEILSSRCSLNSEVGVSHSHPKHPGVKVRSASSSNLTRSASSTDRPQRHSYSNEPDAKFRPSVFDRLSMPRKNKMLVASSAPRLHETGVSRSKSLAGSRGKLAGSQGKLAGSQGKLAKSDSATKVSAGTHQALMAAKDSGKGSGIDGEKPSLSRSSSSSSIPSRAAKEQSTTSTRLSKSNSTSRLSNSPLKPSTRGGRPVSPEPRKPTGHRPFSPDPDKQKTKARPFSPEPKKSAGHPFSPGARPLSPEPKKERGRPFSPEPKKELGFGRAFSQEPVKTPTRALSPEPKKPTRSRPISPEKTRALSPEPAKPKVYRSASSAQASSREKVKKGKNEENSGSGSQGLQRSASARQPFAGNPFQKSASHHSIRKAFQEKKTEMHQSKPEAPLPKASEKQNRLAHDLLDSRDDHAAESDAEIIQYTMGLEPKSHEGGQKVQPPLDKSRPVQRSASDSALLLPKTPQKKSIGAESVLFVPGVHHTPIIGGHLNRNRGHHGIPQDVDKLHSQIMEIRRHLQVHQARRFTDRMIRGRVVNSIPEDIRESECEESEAAAMFEMSSAANNLMKSQSTQNVNLKAGGEGEIDESFRRNSDNVCDNLENVRRHKSSGQGQAIRPISAPDVSMSVKDDVVSTSNVNPGVEANTEPERTGSKEADVSSSASASTSDDGGSIRKDSLETENSSKVLQEENSELKKDIGSNWILMRKTSTEEKNDTKSSSDGPKNSPEQVKTDPLDISSGVQRKSSLEEKIQIRSRFPLQIKMPVILKENSEVSKNSPEISDTKPSGNRLRKYSSESMTDSDRIRLRKKSSEWSQHELLECSDARTTSKGSGDKASLEVSIDDFISNSANTGGESVKDNVRVKTANIDADAALAAKTSYVKMRHSTPRKTTWSAINKRLSDPNLDYPTRHSDPNLDSKTWLDSPPTSNQATPIPEPEEAKPQRISLIDSFYLERRLASPHTSSLQKLFGSSSQIDSQSGSETNLSVMSSALNTRTNALKRDADSFSPDTLSVASTASSRICSPVSDKSSQISSSSKESSKGSSSGGQREPLSNHEDFVAEVYPASPLVLPVKQNTLGVSRHEARSPEKKPGPPPVPAHRSLPFAAGRDASFGESGLALKPPPVPAHRSLETSPSVPAHQNTQETPPRESTISKSPKKEAPPIPSHRNNISEISPSNLTSQKQVAPPIPSHQNRSNEQYPPFRKRDVAPIMPPRIRAQVAKNRDFDIGTYDRDLPPPPVPPHRTSSLHQSNEPVVSPPKDIPHYDEPPPLKSRRKIFFDGGSKSQQAYGGESSEEEGNETISSLAAMDWQTAVTHLQRNRSKSLPADVLEDQAEQLQKTLQQKTIQLEVPDNRLETFEAMRNDVSPQRSKIGRRWSVQNSSMQDLLYGPDRDKSQETLYSGEVSPPSHQGRKHSASTQDLHSLDAKSLHRQYAAAALSPLRNQHDMSVSTPSVHQLGGVRPKQTQQSVFEESFVKPEIAKTDDLNTTVRSKTRSGIINSAFSTGFLNTIQRSASSAMSNGKNSSKHSSSKKLDKSMSESIKSVESSGRKLPGFLNKILSRKRSSKKDKPDKYSYKRKDSLDIDPDADAEDEPDDENEITIVSPVREELVIARKHDDSEILAQELDTDSPNDTLREDRTITESPRQIADRGSFIEEENGLIFFSFLNPARVSPVSTVSSEIQVETSKSDKMQDTTSDSYDSGSEASVADSFGNRFKRVGLGAHESIKLLKEVGASKESLNSAATASGSDSENPLKTRVKLSRTESFRMPRRPKPDPDQKFVRGGVYRGSMPVVKRTPPGSKISPIKDVPVSSLTQDDKRTGIIPRALDLNFIRSTLAQRTTENSSILGSDDVDSGTRQRLSSKSFKSSKPALSEWKLKRENTFTPAEVAKVAHHIQGMAKYSHHGEQKHGGQDAEKYDRDAQKQQAATIVYRSAIGRGTSNLELPRPKSDFLPGQRTEEKTSMRHTQRQRPKSDLGGAKVIGLAVNKQEWRSQLMTQRSFNRQFSDLGADDESSMARGKMRRMSMPHPIKIRKARSKLPSLTRQKSATLKRSHSAPDNLNIMRRSRSTTSLADSNGNSDDAYETMSLASRRSSQSTISPIDDILEDSCTFAEALWDHVTLDVDELPFRAGDVVEVTDMLDKDWWWGRIEDSEGWFPSTFVRLRVNQTDTADDIAIKMREGSIDTSMAMQQVTSGFISKDQARTNVINEIITVERIYVRHLLDVIEGYVKHARKRPEMFSIDRVATIFGNLEQVYTFASNFLQSLELHICREAPFLSEIGQCFLEFKQGFEIYSEYCNNHPYGLCELQMLRCDPKYTQFFEACRLLQEMNEIPLEGFLLTPVQKVCKYPLQLAELLKHTRPDHPDYKKVNEALEAMKGIASLINERKRRMENMEKIALWQTTVEGWLGDDLLDLSSELIHTGELHKYSLNTNGWMKDRVFFLFDHQVVYCKRDLLKRDGLTYKGRIVMDCSDIMSVADGRDAQFNLTVKNAWKIFDRRRDKWFLLCAKTPEDKTKWLNAFRSERKRVKEDRHSGFAFSEQTKRIAQQSVKYRLQRSTETKVRKVSRGNINYVNQNSSTVIPSSSTLTRDSQSFSKKRPWAIFSSKKTAR